eukprot:6060093-Amphidinium_carterae.1
MPRLKDEQAVGAAEGCDEFEVEMELAVTELEIKFTIAWSSTCKFLMRVCVCHMHGVDSEVHRSSF